MTTARLAATVVVLRPGRSAPEILMVLRTRTASFMANAFVFPGGRVDDADGAGEAGLRVAAARELLEEAAVTVDPRSLVPFARWITPSAEPKRFDATFFVTEVPTGTEARVDATEVTQLLWDSAAGFLARHERGEVMLPPPTLHTLSGLAPLASIPAILDWARAQELVPIQPKLVGAPGQATILLPWDPDFASAPGDGEPKLHAPQSPSEGHRVGASRYVWAGARFSAS